MAHPAFQGIISVVVLLIIYYFYNNWPTDTVRARRKEYIFNFKLWPENKTQVLYPTLITIAVTLFFISRMTLIRRQPELDPLWFLSVGVFVQPLFEEIVFRGIILGSLLLYAEKFGITARRSLSLLGILSVGFLFAELHYISEILFGSMRFGVGEFLSKPGGVTRMVDGLLYGAFFWWSDKNISSSYSAHATNNFIVFLYYYSIL